MGTVEIKDVWRNGWRSGAQLASGTVARVVQFLHIGFRLWKVWGIGFAFSLGGGWQIDSALEWMAMQIEWKMYLGPLIVVGSIPYRIKRCPHKLNPTGQGMSHETGKKV